jgi:hypothetical protein
MENPVRLIHEIVGGVVRGDLAVELPGLRRAGTSGLYAARNGAAELIRIGLAMLVIVRWPRLRHDLGETSVFRNGHERRPFDVSNRSGLVPIVPRGIPGRRTERSCHAPLQEAPRFKLADRGVEIRRHLDLGSCRSQLVVGSYLGATQAAASSLELEGVETPLPVTTTTSGMPGFTPSPFKIAASIGTPLRFLRPPRTPPFGTWKITAPATRRAVTCWNIARWISCSGRRLERPLLCARRSRAGGQHSETPRKSLSRLGSFRA